MEKETLNCAAIYHAPDTVYAYPLDETTLCLRLRTAKDDCSFVTARYKNVYEHERVPAAAAMQKIASDRCCDYYEAAVTVPGKRFKYFFEIVDRLGAHWDYAYRGVSLHRDWFDEYFFYPYLFPEDAAKSPEWAAGGLIYQIFIDRFRNGNSANDPAQCLAWGAPPGHESFYGGDFRGIIEKLDYISSLGTTMLYVNPIFLSDSNHKYDAVDYYAIDPAYGTVEDAKELVQKAHRLGMRVILDAVFNHCSSRNALFLDVVQKGAASKYYGWFCIDGPEVVSDPPNYDTFAGLVPEMPRFNTSNPEVADYLIDAAVYWTRTLQIDGWRLDVADEVSHVLWRKFQTRLRSVNPDIFILGEAWNQATKWLLGDEFDSVTDYKFRGALLAFAGDPSRGQKDFWEETAHNEMNYRSTSLPYMVHLVSSHDVRRMRTELGGDAALARLAVGVTLTYTGIPSIFYGDEIGMEGREDPDNRRTMVWEPEGQDTGLLDFVRSLGKLRRADPALRSGSAEKLSDLPSRVLGFVRRMKAAAGGGASEECRIVLANFSAQETDVSINPGLFSAPEDFRKLVSVLDSRSFACDKTQPCNIRLRAHDFLILGAGRAAGGNSAS